MKKHLLLWMALFILLTASCGSDPLAASYVVKYTVTGTAETGNIDYFDENGGLAIINGIQIPWSHSFSASRGHEVYITAQRTSQQGTVTVTIYRNNEILDQATSSDGGAATAQGTI